MTDYVIVSNTSLETLMTDVKALQDQVYKLAGGIAVVYDTGNTTLVFAQALFMEQFARG